MANGYEPQPILNFYEKKRVETQTYDLNVSRFQRTDAFVFFIVVRSWTAMPSHFCVYIMQGIQSGAYQNVTEVCRGGETTSKVEIKDTHTVTITFFNSAGGLFSVVPLM